MNIATDIRILVRLLIETFNSIKRAGWMNWVVISTMAAILSIFGCMFRISLGIDNFVKEFGSVLEISVYLQDSTNAEAFIKKVQAMPDIKKIKFISKDEAWQVIKKEYSAPDINNPLPNTLHIQLTKVEFINPMVKKLSQMPGVESVNYERSVVEQLRKISNTTSIATIILVVLLGGLTLFIISNTIQLLIQSCSREIEIMSMMGVSGWYIKMPYLLQGAFYGLTGSLLALIPLFILQSYILKIYNYISVSPPALNMNLVVFSIILIGIFVGALGSLLSIRKFLKI